MAQSILGAARAEGYRDGIGQNAQAHYEDGFADGMASAEQTRPSRLRWLLIGAIVGEILATFIR